MLSVPNIVGRFHDSRPSTGGSSCEDGIIAIVFCNNLEFGSITAVEDLASIVDFGLGVYSRVIPSTNNTLCQAFEAKRRKSSKNVPSNLIINRENIPLRMEMFPSTDLSQIIHRHNPHIQGQKRFSIFISRHCRNTVTLTCHCMRL